MDDNKKKDRLISDALINRTEDFLIEEDDISFTEDIKNDDEPIKDGSANRPTNLGSLFIDTQAEIPDLTNRVLVTEEYDDEELFNVQSEIIVPDKKHTKTATGYLSIDHVTDLYSPNTGTFNTMSVHDASFIKRGDQSIPEKINDFNLSTKNKNLVPNANQFNRSPQTDFIQRTNKAFNNRDDNYKIDLDKLDTVEFKLEPNNKAQQQIKTSASTPNNNKFDSLFGNDHWSSDSRTLDTLASRAAAKANMFESSSIIKEFNNQDLPFKKANYRDDRIEKSNRVDFDLGDTDYLMEEMSFQQGNDYVTDNHSRIDLNLENDPSVIPKKMTVNMQNIESDIDQITKGDKSNLYRYIKTGNSNLTTSTFLKRATQKPEVNNNEEFKNDLAHSEEIKMVLNNKQSLFEQIDNQIKQEKKQEAQLKKEEEKRARIKSYPDDYDNLEQVKEIEANRPKPTTRRGTNKRNNPQTKKFLKFFYSIIALTLLAIIIVAIIIFTKPSAI
ncbi:hypothetical protein [[Mycoplasma] imitans]|uniref:hypothetical protein n=1 Tax=[Mycoplasma] imitans TaxID=29560 RepID=UPI000488E357|nr:hypothetical protein [[Mycoplasma] imitans]